jgi:CHASE3 domain sensor protein
MSTNDATSTIRGNAAGAPATTAPAPILDRTSARREWWRFAARPLILASGFLVLAVISAASIFFIAITKSNAELMTHTLLVENQLSSLRVLIRAAEGGERGYLLSGEPGYLKDFQDAAEMIMPTLAELKKMTADNPAQQHAVAELTPLITQRIDKMHEVTRSYDTGNAAAAVALVRAGRGRVLMEGIRTILARMTDEEERLLALRTSNASRGNFLLLIVNLAGIALIIARIFYWWKTTPMTSS